MRQRLVVLALTVAAAGAAGPALAIPAFARRYKVECHFCHDIYPKLNAMGQRFRERGFRMEHEDEFDAAKWARTVPLTGRAEGNHTFVESAKDTNFGFLKGISAGNLGKRIAYWVDDGVRINEKQSSSDDRFTHTKPDNAWLRIELVDDGKLYVRGGRIELDLPFTETRSPHLFGYDVYFANTGFETDNIGQYQDGIEVGGDLPRDAHWSAAVVKGRNSDAAMEASSEAGKFDANLFLRLAKRVDRHRFGAFAYIGRNTLAEGLVRFPEAPPGPSALVWDETLLRLGADASVWVGKLNLYGVFLYGRNDNSLATLEQPTGTQQSLSFAGGFAQADFRLRDEAALTLRLDAVNRPPAGSTGPKQTFSSVTPGLQLWILDGYAKVSFEYVFQNQGRPNFGAVQAEVAF